MLALDAETADGFGQSLVVGEDDHLPRERGLFERAGQAVDAGGVHGLHRVVDHDEPERAFGQGGAWQEQAERQRVQFALAHHAQGGAGDAVNGDVERHLALGAFAPTSSILPSVTLLC